MSVKEPIKVHTEFGRETTILIDYLDRIMKSYTPQQREIILSIAAGMKPPQKNFADTPFEETVKIAAVIGLEMCGKISQQRDATLNRVATGN